MEITGKEKGMHNAFFTGDALRAHIADSGVSALKKRDCLGEILDYLRGREKRVLGLCGLHRTGRTTMLYQAMEALGQYEDMLLVIGSGADVDALETDAITNTNALETADTANSIEIVRHILLETDCHYLFVDEVAAFPDLIQNGGFLADELVQSGKKVILAGGDGDELVLLKENVMPDKLRLLKTSYLSFREYQKFLGGELSDYFGYQSENSLDKIQRIADKYAESGDEMQELSVFLGKTGKILKSMDVLAEIPENGRSYHTTFTQPGLISAEDAEIQKDVIVTDLLKDRVVSGANVIAKYKSDGGEVFDLVLINKKNRRCVAIQVANTDQREENQARNLTDKIVCRELQEYFGGRLVGRYVFYNGPDARAFKVQYVNCTEFLSRGAVFWNMMEKLEGG